jgi:hypothetical protein
MCEDVCMTENVCAHIFILIADKFYGRNDKGPQSFVKMTQL